MRFNFSSVAVTSLTFGLISALSSISAQAVNVVGVFGNSCGGCSFSLSTINNYYNSGLTVSGQPVSSSILTGTLDTNNLSNINLLWMVQPAQSYTTTELNSLSTFLSGGGRIAFLGEHGTIAPNENNRISAAITALGGNISIINTVVDGGQYFNATVGNGQILSNPLTAGVNTYNYAAFAPLTISGSAISLMNGINPSNVMMAYQNIGAGSIFAITDQNVWDNVSQTGTNDNGILFQNLLGANTGAPSPTAVPEPFTIIGTFIGGTAALRMRKKLKSSTKV